MFKVNNKDSRTTLMALYESNLRLLKCESELYGNTTKVINLTSYENLMAYLVFQRTIKEKKVGPCGSPPKLVFALGKNWPNVDKLSPKQRSR